MKNVSLIIISILCLSGCGKTSDKFVLKGDIKDLGNDTILVYGLDENRDRIDTIYAENGKFDYEINVDTITPVAFLFGKLGEECIVYADKGLKSTMTGDRLSLHALQVKGGILNEELSAFRATLSGLPQDSAVTVNQAEVFIRSHPFSLVSIHLLDKYFVRTLHPDINKIKELQKTMSGDLLDNSYMKRLGEVLDRQKTLSVGSRAPYFVNKNQKGESINLNTFKDKYLLIDFWASWCDRCMEEQATLKKLNKKYKKEKFAILGVSLDIEKDKWKEAIKKDTLSWEQITDFKGWENTVVRQFGINTLPSNVLLDTAGKIIATNLTKEELAGKLEEIFK